MLDEWGLARFIGYLGGAVAFCFFTHRRESLDAPPDHGLRRRVLRDAIRPPAYPGIPMDQDADAPHGAAKDDEQVNKFHAPQNRAAHKQNER